jgi:polyribonucleotide nucleotidyltransferase
MTVIKVEAEIDGRNLSLETGYLAKQAEGAVLVRYGETVVLATVVSSDPRPDIDYFPLTVDYREKTSAAGKFPGGFIKREGRPSTKEILTARMVDRPIRPLFPAGYFNEVLVQVLVLSADGQNDPDVLAIIGSSAALAISSIPFEGPIGAVRIGRLDGKFVVMPTTAQLDHSEMDLLVTGTDSAINMIEMGARELPEKTVLEALEQGHQIIRTIVALQQELAAKVGKPKHCELHQPPEELRRRIDGYAEPLRQARRIAGKQERAAAVDKIKSEALAQLTAVDSATGRPAHDPAQVKLLFDALEEKLVRELILAGVRADGRDATTIRPLACHVAILPRTHGSAIFSRGETQALVTTTLGTGDDEQIVDGLGPEYAKKFMLHYNFPPFATGEVKRIMGPGRREIGHGALAERALEPVLPTPQQFPYVVRLVSDILESNGSSSMASVCGGTLALLDAGVPLIRPVAGISIGLVGDGSRDVLLTDIIGEEDHFGDMDFKVAGTTEGITAIQLDLKIRGLRMALIAATLEQARLARLTILDKMKATIATHRPQISAYAPRLLTIHINPEKIGKVIGPGGKTIKKIVETTGAKIDIEDDGTVFISAVGMEAAERAREEVERLTEDVKVGRIYTGRVTSVKDFGAFIEVTPGVDGLCHISELSDKYLKNVGEAVKIGQEVRVKVIAIDDQGRIKLSRKQVLRQEALAAKGPTDPTPSSAPAPVAPATAPR